MNIGNSLKDLSKLMSCSKREALFAERSFSRRAVEANPECRKNLPSVPALMEVKVMGSV
jgi:hypothetical protein